MKKILCALFLSTMTVSTNAQTFPVFEGRPVIDQADLLPAANETKLNEQINEFRSRTSQQLAVVTINSLEGLDIESYANKMFRYYGVGDADLHNGVLFLVAPNERLMRIEVGYGNEPFFTDLDASIIIHEIVTPRFKANNMVAGIEQGTMAIIKEATPPTPEQLAIASKKAREEAIRWEEFMSFLYSIFAVIGSFIAAGTVIVWVKRTLRANRRYLDLNAERDTKEKIEKARAALAASQARADQMSQRLAEDREMRRKAALNQAPSLARVSSSRRTGSSVSTPSSGWESVLTPTSGWDSVTTPTSGWVSDSDSRSSSEYGGGSSGGGGDSGGWSGGGDSGGW